MKKISQNRLVSISISVILSIFLAMELLILIQIFQIQVSSGLINGIVWSLTAVLCLIMQKKIYENNKNRLIKYFFFGIVTAIAAVIFTINLLFQLWKIPFVSSLIQKQFESQNSLFINAAANALFLLLLIVFTVTFALIMNSKVKYIQYISYNIKNMEENGFGKTIDVKNEDELSELSKSINSLSLALLEKQENEKKEEERKNRIIADISHDLRTPLTSVVGYFNLLKEDEFEHKELCREYMEVIDRRINHMTSMINQLFEYTKLIQLDTPMKREQVNLTAVISYIDYEYGHLLKTIGKKWTAVYPEYEIFLMMDEEKIMRAFGNLLDNAKKYSLPESEILMKVSDRREHVLIEISNETEHLQPEYLDEMFERFYRVDVSRTENEKNGTGLGLPIIKRIVELHGGSISSKLDGKTITFQVILPKEG